MRAGRRREHPRSGAAHLVRQPRVLLGVGVVKFNDAPNGGAGLRLFDWPQGMGDEPLRFDGGLAPEAELIHGRIAQVAVVGFIAPGLFGTLPGNEYTGFDAYSNTNPLEAFSQVPGAAILQIFLFMTYLEIRRINIIREEGAAYMPGDLRIGQGEGRYNPFGLDYTPEEYEEKRLQELKHCRLAMIGIFGLWAQAQASGVGITDQLGAAFSTPDYVAKAGYFLPEGI